MASTPVEFRAPSGLTLTLKLFAYGSDTLVNTGGDSCTEATNCKGRYSATVTEAATGWHDAIVIDGSSNLIVVSSVYMEDDTDIHRAEDAPIRAYDAHDGVNIYAVGGTAQTAGDIPARLPAALGANGNMKSDVRDLLATAWLTPGTAGTPDVNTKLVGGTSQTGGDIYAYLTTNLGLLGASLFAIPKTGFKLASDGLAAVTAWTVALTGSLSGSVGSVTGAVGSVTGNVGGNVVGSVGSLATQAKADVNAEADTALSDVGLTTTVTGRIDRALSALFTTAMTESYNTDGSAATPAQALYVIMQMLTEMNFSGTTGTVKKLDGSTTAFTVTINSSTLPTAVTRAS